MAQGAGAGSTHLRYATPWQARWHVTAPPLRFGTGLATPEQSGGGRLERAQARQPTIWQRHHAAALRAAGLYTTRGAKGGHGGKVRFPPCSMCMAFTKCIAHSHWLAVCIAQSRYCEQRMSDRSDLSDLSDDWHMAVCVPCAPEISQHMAQLLGRTSLGKI